MGHMVLQTHDYKECYISDLEEKLFITRNPYTAKK